MRITVFLFTAFFLAVPVWTVAGADILSSEPAFSMEDDRYFETEEFQALRIRGKIRRVADESLAFIYDTYGDPLFEEVKTDYLENALRIYALQRGETKVVEILKRIRRGGVDKEAPEFVRIYAEVTEWVVAENRKSGEELYRRAQIKNLEAIFEYGPVHTLRYVYLRMAAEKGHPKARIEFTMRQRVLLDMIQDPYMKEFKKRSKASIQQMKDRYKREKIQKK